VGYSALDWDYTAFHAKVNISKVLNFDRKSSAFFCSDLAFVTKARPPESGGLAEMIKVCHCETSSYFLVIARRAKPDVAIRPSCRVIRIFLRTANGRPYEGYRRRM